MSRPSSALILWPVVWLSACAGPLGGGQPAAEPVHQATFLAGQVASEFALNERGALIRYADGSRGSQSARDAAADAVAQRLLAQRGGRVALAGVSTANPGHAASFDGFSGRVLFSVYCKGHCQDLVLRVRGPAGRTVAATLRGEYALPVVEVVVPTGYPASVSFEVDASRSDLRQLSDLTVTQWAGQFWNHRPAGFLQ